MFGSCWEIGPDAERFVVPCGDDLVIAPAHRRRGLFGRIMDATVADLAAHGHPVTFSLSAGPVALVGSLARGWRSVGSVREVSRVAGPTALLWRPAMRVRSWPGARRLANAVSHVWRQPFRHLDTVARRTPAGSAVWCTREPRPEAMADLVKRLGHDGRARHVRDARYLAWRFANPLHEYRFLLAGEDVLEGYLVLQAYRLVGRGRVNVVDWEAASPAVRRALLGAAIDWGRFAELSTWTMSLPEEAGAILRESGFLPVTRDRRLPQGLAVLVRSVTPSPSEPGPALGGRRLLDAANWDMRMLYSMAG
jgi:GNAT superfamily N-acetyltransferase